MQIYANIQLGFSPILNIASDGTREVLQVAGWTNGVGTMPSTGMYLGSTGYVSAISDAINIKGDAGAGIAFQEGTDILSAGTVLFSNSPTVTFGLAGSVLTASAAGGGGGGNVSIMGSTGNIIFANSNGMTFGGNNSTITASYTVPSVTQFQLLADMTNYLGTGATVSFLFTNQSSLFQQTSQMSLYQPTSLMSNYQSTGNYLTTAMASNAGSNFVGLNSALTANGVSASINSSGISLNFPAFLTTAQPVGAYLTTAMQSNAATISNIKVSAGTLSTNRSDISFNNSNGVSFGLETNGAITATVATNYQSQGAYLTTAMQSQSSSAFVNTSQSSLFQATSLMSNYQSANAGYLTSQSNQAFSASGSSSTFQTLQFGNTNGVSFSISNGSIVGTVATNYQSQGAYLTTAMQSNAATISNIKLSAGTLSSNRSDMTFSNANGVSFGLETNGVITASVAAAGGAQTGISALSAGTTQMSSGTASFADGGGVSFGINGNTLTATVRTDYQSSGNYLTTAMASNASTNFAGIGSAITNGTMTFGTGGLSLNLSNHLTTAALSSQTLAFSLSGNIATTNSSQILNGGYALAGGNGVTLQQSNNTVSFSVATNYQSQGAYLTTAMASNASTNFAGIGSAITNGTMTFGTGGLSLNLSNHLTTARASNDAIGLNTALTANGVAWTVNSSGLSLNIPAFLTTAMQSQSSSNFAGVGSAITNGTMTYGTGGLSLNLSNHLTTAMASNAGSNFVGLNSALTANGVSASINSSGISLNFPAFLTTAMASNQSSNFAGIGFTSTTAAGAVIAGTHNTAGLLLAVPAWLTTAAQSDHSHGNPTLSLAGGLSGATASNSAGFTLSLTQAGAAASPIGVSAGTVNNTFGSLTFSNSPSVSFGLGTGASAGVITASVNAGAGGGIALANSQTTYTSGTANMIASGALTIGSTTGQSFYFSAPAQSSLSATGQLSISVNGSTISMGVPNDITLSEYAPFPLGNNTTFSSAGQSSIYLQKIQPIEAFSFSAIERWASLSFASSTNNASVNYSILYGIYSRDTGTNNTRMTRMGSSQMDIRAAFSSNSSMAASIVVGANTVATGSAGTGLYTNITAGRHIYFPYATSLAGGNEYWVAFNIQSASTITSTPLRMAFLELTFINNLTWGKIKSDNFYQTNASYVDDFAQGVFTAQSAALPVTIADNQISNQVSLGRQYIQFDNN